MTKKKEPGIEEITLRDFFAAFALQGMLSEPTLQATMQEFAKRSYLIADAMIEARQKNWRLPKND